MHEEALPALRYRLKGPAGGEDQAAAVGMGIDARAIEAHDLRSRHREYRSPPVAPGDPDRVAPADGAEPLEMGVAVRGVDGRAALTGLGRPRDMGRTEGERLPAGAGESDGIEGEAGISIRASGQLSNQDQGFTGTPVARDCAKARSRRTCASTALAWIHSPCPAKTTPAAASTAQIPSLAARRHPRARRREDRMATSPALMRGAGP